MLTQTKVCGILGGLGPTATADLYRAIIAHTPAQLDQEHLHVIINSNPRIPDRTAAILKGTTEPVPGLIKSLQTLERAGADFAVIPCNTAHHFLPELQAATSLPILDMIDLTAQYIAQLGYKSVSIISTNATLKSELYQRALANHQIELVIPDLEHINKAMQVIYGPEGIKAGTKYEFSQHNRQLCLDLVSHAQAQGAAAMILGCTEIPLAICPTDTEMPLVNPTTVLAQAIIAHCQS